MWWKREKVSGVCGKRLSSWLRMEVEVRAAMSGSELCSRLEERCTDVTSRPSFTSTEEPRVTASSEKGLVDCSLCSLHLMHVQC